MFTDRLKLQIALTIGSNAFTIEGGAVSELVLDMTTYGFEAKLSFVVSSEQQADPIFAAFITRDLIRASVTAERMLEDGSSDEDATPLSVIGYVTEKGVAEIIGETLTGAPVIERVYTIRFFDPAAIFWGEHYPVELHSGAAMAEVLALHSAQGMTITYDWTRLGDKLDVLCLGLEVDRRASFYDFAIWYVNRYDGVLELDATSGTYRFGGDKSTPSANTELDFDDVAGVRIEVAEPPRHMTHVLNPSADAAILDTPIPNTNAVLGIRRDVLERTPIGSVFDRRVLLETGRLQPGDHGIALSFKRFPEELPVPNGGVVFEERFSTAMYTAPQQYRATTLHLEARATRTIPQMDVDDPGATFAMELTLGAELQTNRDRHLPAFRQPRWPVLVEGWIVSASGQATDRTWFSQANEDNSIVQYQVDVPLWNTTIVAPFSPNHMTGHFFFPAYKKQRVLLGIGFDQAEIVGYLDWADNAKLSKDTQGNAIAFGYGAGNGTLLTHQYADGQPAFQIQRTLGGDQETMNVTEGVIFLQVKEDPLAPVVVPTFDVSAQVEGAKAEIASGVNSALGDVTGSFETSIGGVKSTLQDATTEVGTTVTAASAALVTQIEGVEGQLSALGSSATAAVAALAGAVADAKTALQSALSS